MINTVPPASNSVFQVFGRLKNGFDITKLIFQVTCLTVVQWSRSCLHVQINWVPLPAMLFSVSLYFFFSVWSLFFDTIFPFGLFSFILTADPADHEHWSIYILCLSPKFYFGKGISRSKPIEPLICILAKLTARKNHKLPRHVPPLKQLNFFKC